MQVKSSTFRWCSRLSQSIQRLAYRLGFEWLESRELLSYTVTIDGDSLHIEGTDKQECIYLIQERTGYDIREFCRGEKKSHQFVAGSFASVSIDTRGGDDKLVLKALRAVDVDVVLGSGNDTFRYYDHKNSELCIDMGDGNDVAKARRNQIVDYMLDGGDGQDKLIHWNNNKFSIKDLTSVESEKLFNNGKLRAAA